MQTQKVPFEDNNTQLSQGIEEDFCLLVKQETNGKLGSLKSLWNLDT